MSEPGARTPVSRVSGPSLLRLARKDREAARKQLRALDPEIQAQLCQELRATVRSEFLMLLDQPEEVVPLLAEAELCSTIRESGMSEAAWLLELATPDQRRACLDLDCWWAEELNLARVVEWVDAVIEAGRPTLLAMLRDLDPEIWILALRQMADVVVVGKEDEPPIGYFTEDGVVYFRGNSDEDFARVREIAGTAFSEAQPYYWQLVYGMLFELQTECEEYALSWRNARLADLGFPGREQAMQAYRPLSVDEVRPLDVGDWQDGTPSNLVPAQALPQQLEGTLVGRALGELPPDRAGDVLGYVLGVANAVAVASRLPLADPDSVRRALELSVRGIDLGLRELSKARSQTPVDVLDVTRPLDLFRIGATLEPALRLRVEEDPA